jgi:hypothetical protein
MYNAGQTCCASKRFIVVEEIADQFLAKFKTALEALKPGDPMDEKTTHGPLSTESALVDLLKQVDSAVAKGAKVALGGKRIDRAGSFMEATILTDVKPDNPAFRDEFFGPVAMFFRVKDEAAAIALANDSDFGLGGSVFTNTKDIARGNRVASQVETGMMFINNIDWSDAELPFGGIKDSGYGRELGNMGIQEFVSPSHPVFCAYDEPMGYTAASTTHGFGLPIVGSLPERRERAGRLSRDIHHRRRIGALRVRLHAGSPHGGKCCGTEPALGQWLQYISRQVQSLAGERRQESLGAGPIDWFRGAQPSPRRGRGHA